MKEIETPQATPEQLLIMLDGQLHMQQARRGGAGRNRAMLLAGGVLFIVIAAGIALVVLSQMLSELPHGDRQPTAQAAAPSADGKF